MSTNVRDIIFSGKPPMNDCPAWRSAKSVSTCRTE